MTIFLLQHLQFLTYIPDPLFGLFGFRPRQPVVTTQNPFAGIDPEILLGLAKNLKKEAVADEVFSSEASLEEDVELAYLDEEPKSEREVRKKQKGARFLDGLLKGAGDFFGNPLGAIGNVVKGVSNGIGGLVRGAANVGTNLVNAGAQVIGKGLQTGAKVLAIPGQLITNALRPKGPMPVPQPGYQGQVPPQQQLNQQQLQQLQQQQQLQQWQQQQLQQWQQQQQYYYPGQFQLDAAPVADAAAAPAPGPQ